MPANERRMPTVDRSVDRTVCLPGSKSLTNRALLVAALADGVSELRGLLLADDTRLMIGGLEALGISIDLDPTRCRAAIRGCGGHWPSDHAHVSCGNAGTVLRFLMAGAAVGQGWYRFDGVERLRRRPIEPLVDALQDLGASVGYDERDGSCPLTLRARGLRGGHVRFDRPVSSQFISALLMAAPRAASDVFIEVDRGVPSAPYIAMTLALMSDFGVSAVEDGMARFIVPGMQPYVGRRYEIEPDASAASYFFAAAAVTGGRVTVDGLGRSSVQGDAGFVNVLGDMGCTIERDERSTTVRGPSTGKLTGVDVDLCHMPDVAPTLAVTALFAEGPTRIRGVANLRYKECDRLSALALELDRLGARYEVHDDGLTVEGRSSADRPHPDLHGAAIETYDDHRMAMSFAVAALRIPGIAIRDPGCVSKTFPEFFDVWTDMLG